MATHYHRIEQELRKVPFEVGETLFSYAKRLTKDEGYGDWAICDIRTSVDFNEIRVMGSSIPSYSISNETIIVELIK